ncbi:MAG: phosphate ABC transporter permease subunit PstC [Actinomycetota bacterium]|nr:phosphate ABC transporter permease subunit PstC [Actinomycetota bacterium]
MAQAASPRLGKSGKVELSDLRISARRQRRETLIMRTFQAAAVVSIVISALIVASLIERAVSFATQVDLSDLAAGGWFPRRSMFGVPTIVAGSMIVAGIAMLVAAPLGLGAAIYLAEYARPQVRKVIKPVLEILAGIPSVVVGVFALSWISPQIIGRLSGDAGLFNMAAAGIGVGVLVTPLVASVAEDSFRAVPMSLREASYGLGAKKRSTTTKVVFPAAISGVVASIILGVSRAIGETMVVLIVAGGTGGAEFTLNPFNAGQTMTGAMAALARGSDQVKGADLAFPSLFFVGLLLFLITLTLNVVSERYVRRVRQKY